MALATDEAADQPAVPADISLRVASPSAYGAWTQIHDDFTWLRRELPLGIARVPGYDQFWVVTKHADIKEISRQPQIFANNGFRKSLISQEFADRAAAAKAAGGTAVVSSLLTMDPPPHHAYRSITSKAFTPAGIRSLEEYARDLAREAIDGMRGNDTCDFADAVASRFPLRMILAMLGLPRSDEELLLNMTKRFFHPQDRDIAGVQKGNSVGATSNHDVMREMEDYFASITRSRRAKPTDDIASTIANAEIDGHPISEWDAASYYMNIATAGHDTTASSIAGGVWALAEYPDEFMKVKADRSLIPALVEEAIRWTSPVIHFMRTARQDYELRGQSIRAGDWLMLCYPAANRDEEVFDSPFMFRADRKPNPQLAFGFGAHVCLGQHMARMEMQAFFKEFFERVDHVELAGEPTRIDSLLISGIKTLPVRYKLAA